MQYVIYLEVQPDGATMAHVPSLPGCASTGATQEVAIARAPDAIAAHLAWLRAHGEPTVSEQEPIEIEIGGTSRIPIRTSATRPASCPPTRPPSARPRSHN